MIRVGFLPLYQIRYPSSRYRVFQFLEPLQREGFLCTLLEAPQRDLLRRLLYLPRLWHLARTQDVLYIQKRTFPKPVLQSLRRINPRLIFDLDDAIFLRSHTKQRVDHMLSAAAMIVAGNSYLANYARHLNHRVVVIPTVVDTKVYHPPNGPRHPGDHRVILGWIGQNPNRGDLIPLRPVFDELAKRYGNRVVLRIVSDQPLEMTTLLAQEFIPWSLEVGRNALQHFDIGIMPLEDTEWNRGKCGFKLIQYMAVGAAAVASPVGNNLEIITHGENGYLADTCETWVANLAQLIDNPELRARMGQAARLRVETAYSVQAVLPFLKSAMEHVAGYVL